MHSVRPFEPMNIQYKV